ncbi:hypothetical protein EVAR_90071_1 [Eumeta japonica]|uniref:Uncharacterized protein n=1 Tax=Eumeta variegata TaxID=151549 RepID=A0A4C1TD36_EUMVA|nr:hypothetical protein EVAR_90071_1 [Eumeta japonica]
MRIPRCRRIALMRPSYTSVARDYKSDIESAVGVRGACTAQPAPRLRALRALAVPRATMGNAFIWICSVAAAPTSSWWTRTLSGWSGHRAGITAAQRNVRSVRWVTTNYRYR